MAVEAGTSGSFCAFESLEASFNGLPKCRSVCQDIELQLKPLCPCAFAAVAAVAATAAAVAVAVVGAFAAVAAVAAAAINPTLNKHPHRIKSLNIKSSRICESDFFRS